MKDLREHIIDELTWIIPAVVFLLIFLILTIKL